MKGSEEQLIVRLMSGEYRYNDILELYDRLTLDENNKELVTILEYLGKKPNINTDSRESYLKCLSGLNSSSCYLKTGIKALSACIAVLATVLVLFLTNVIGKNETKVKYLAGNAISKVELPDGTKIIMAKGSEIECPETFSGKERRIKLTGEAFFDVAHDNSKPFFVDAEDVSIMVTGTRFDVANDIENKTVTTTLVEGSIRFMGKEETMDVLPGEQVIFNKETETITRKMVDAGKETRWVDEIHRYRSVPLSSMAEDLSNLFGYTIILDPELKDVVLSGSFRNDYSITDVLEILESCLDIEYKISKNAVFIHKAN